MPMPDLGTPATTGGLTGLCISSQAADAGTAADFLVYASSPEALGDVASAGYLQPANQAVGALRRLPAAGPPARARVGVHVQRQEHEFPPLVEPVGRARRGDRAARRCCRPAAARAAHARPSARTAGAAPAQVPRRPRRAGPRARRVSPRSSIGRRPRTCGCASSRRPAGDRGRPRRSRPPARAPTSSTCQGRAPYRSSRSATAAASRSPGGVHSPAHGVGGEQVLGRYVVLLRERASPSRASTSRSAATGSRSAQARGSGGPSVRGARAGRSSSCIVAARWRASSQRRSSAGRRGRGTRGCRAARRAWSASPARQRRSRRRR